MKRRQFIQSIGLGTMAAGGVFALLYNPGHFTSTGINDNATGEVLSLEDALHEELIAALNDSFDDAMHQELTTITLPDGRIITYEEIMNNGNYMKVDINGRTRYLSVA